MRPAAQHGGARRRRTDPRRERPTGLDL